MSRPVKGDTRVQQYRRTLKNGVIYVYEREVKYNPETRRNDTLSNKLIGKILPDTNGTMIETKFRTPPFEYAEKKNDNDQGAQKEGSTENESKDKLYSSISRYHMGMMSILEWAGKESGIDDDIRNAIPSDEAGELANRIIKLARFWVATDGNTLPNLEAWQIHHGIQREEQITEDICHNIFENLGQNEKYIQKFFKNRAKRLNVKDSIAYDSSTISTYSVNQIQARFGYNKDKDGLPTIKILTLYSLDVGQPFAYATQPGNLPDVICLKNALKELDFLDIEKPMLVMDNGFYSGENAVTMVHENMKFMVRVMPKDATWIRKAVDENLEKLNDPNTGLISWDSDVVGCSCTVRPELTYTYKRNSANHKKGDVEKLTPRLYLMIYQNQSLKYECIHNLMREINSLKVHIENGGEDELDDHSLSRAHNFLSWGNVKGNKIRVQIKTDVYEEAIKYAGVYSILSNQEKDKDRGLQIYRKREHIEDLFELFKQKADGKKPRVWTSDRLRGREFVQFAALCYYDFLYSKIKSVKQSLIGPEDPSMGKIHNRIRKQVKTWLDNVSLNDILQWFDAVEITRLIGKKSQSIKIVTERIARDKMFLELLGYGGEMLG